MTGPPVILGIRQAELTFSSVFERPAFAFLDWSRLEASIYGAFQPFQLRLGDIKVESTTPHPADFSVVAWLPGAGSHRFRLDKLELWSQSLQVVRDARLVSSLLTQAREAVRATSLDTGISSHTVSLGVHGFPEGTDASAVLAGFAGPLPQGDPPVPSPGSAPLEPRPLPGDRCRRHRRHGG